MDEMVPSRTQPATAFEEMHRGAGGDSSWSGSGLGSRALPGEKFGTMIALRALHALSMRGQQWFAR